MRRTSLLSTVVPVAAAIAVFGVVYGAAAQPVLGAPLTVTASLVVFSGAAQFSMVGLLTAGASPATVLWAVAVLNLRHLALGAVVRPRLGGGTMRRAALAWFLLDETVGLAMAGRDRVATVFLTAGTACYIAWLAGTIAGVAGGAAFGLEGLAAAVFPVLFVGLASIIARGRDALVRAVLAAALTLLFLALWPALEGLAPVLAAVTVSLPRGRP